MKPKKGICAECKKEKWYGHKAKELCEYCNESRKKKEKKEKGKTPYRYVRKQTGEKELFRYIWETRPHECEHCGLPLREPRAHYFAHIKSKGAYPELRLEESNIKLFCFDFTNSSNGCHYLFDSGDNAQFEARRDKHRKK